MKTSSSNVLAVLAVILTPSLVAASPLSSEPTPWRCGNAHPSWTAPMQKLLKDPLVTSNYAHNTTSSSTDPAEEPRITVPVHMHFVLDNATAALLPSSALDPIAWKQFFVLHDAFAKTGIDMVLKDNAFGRTVGDAGIEPADGQVRPDSDALGPELAHFLAAHREGDYATLNLFFFARMPPELGGMCTFPDMHGVSADELRAKDSCVVALSSLPIDEKLRDKLGQQRPAGKSEPKKNVKGWSTVHEVGHWFGLLHTWEGGCDRPDDLVEDTPRQVLPNTFCVDPARLDCDFKSGDSKKDADKKPEVTMNADKHTDYNFMDYGIDYCHEGVQPSFTPGQVKRMHTLFQTLRQGKTA